MSYGWREGRNPSRGFNTLYYRDRYLDGAEENPLSHYVRAGGKSSGLAPSAPSEEDFVKLQRTVVTDAFDRGFYECQVTDVSQDLLTHYLTVGWREGLSPSPTFDVKQYYSEHSYVKSLDVSPLYHFASQRRMRSRASAPKPTSVSSREPVSSTSAEKVKSIVATEFDRTYYLERNEDVKNAGADPLLHFLEYGWRERRNPNALFDVTYYLAANPDVVERKINPFFHYLTEGRAEGRRANPAGYHPHPSLRAPCWEAWDKVSPAAATQEAEYIVVMPVYKGYDETWD